MGQHDRCALARLRQVQFDAVRRDDAATCGGVGHSRPPGPNVREPPGAAQVRRGGWSRRRAKMTGMEPYAARSASPFIGAVQTIIESDEEIGQALAEAEVPPLLPALAYLTGDMSLLREELRPDPMLMGMPQGGLTDDQQVEARQLALDALIRYRDGGC